MIAIAHKVPLYRSLSFPSGKIVEDGKSRAPETEVKKPSAEVKTVPNEAPQTNGNESKAWSSDPRASECHHHINKKWFN